MISRVLTPTTPFYPHGPHRAPSFAPRGLSPATEYPSAGSSPSSSMSGYVPPESRELSNSLRSWSLECAGIHHHHHDAPNPSVKFLRDPRL